MEHYLEPQRYEDNNVLVYKRADYGINSNYYCRVKVSAERRYLVRSTKTKELGAAHQFALSLYSEAEILKKHNGTAKLWVPTFEAVAKQYLVDLEERVELGLETKSRLHNVRYGIKVWIP